MIYEEGNALDMFVRAFCGLSFKGNFNIKNKEFAALMTWEAQIIHRVKDREMYMVQSYWVIYSQTAAWEPGRSENSCMCYIFSAFLVFFQVAWENTITLILHNGNKGMK